MQWSKKLRKKFPLKATVVAAVAALTPMAAHADVVSAFWYAVTWLSTSSAAASAALMAAYNYGAYIAMAAIYTYGSMDARRRAKHAQQDATNYYNSKLEERTVTALRSSPPWRIIYGTARTGGDIVAILTSDKSGTHDDQSSYVKADGYKHLVIVVAAHEVDDITEMYIDGVAVGALDGSGWATTGDLYKVLTARKEVSLAMGASATFPSAPTVVAAVDALNYFPPDNPGPSVTYTISGNTVTNTYGATASFSVTYQTSQSSIRWSKHLGTTTQTVDTYLSATVPSQWTPNDRLQELAYVVVTLDLEDQRFQGGPPQMSWDVRGRKVYDPRTSTTAWSDNPALCIRDYLTAPWGFECVAAQDIDDAFTIAAANACEVSTAFYTTILGSPVTTMAAAYTCNGIVYSSDDRKQTLRDLSASMAGFTVYGAKWQITAGSWTSPVLTLGDDFLDGQIEIIQAGAGLGEIFNGSRGSYMPVASSATSDYSYANSTFVAADGRELWTETSFLFTNGVSRCRNIARILVEANRDSQIIRYPANLNAWPLLVGERVTIVNAEYGFNKTFRITDWQFGVTSPVVLILQEDSAGIYDQADAVEVDPTPNTNLPNPWTVSALTGLMASSSAGTVQISPEGTVAARVLLTWNASTDAYIADGVGQIEISWRIIGKDLPNTWRVLLVPGNSISVLLVGAVHGDVITANAVAVNSLTFRSAVASVTHTVYGLPALPAAPTGIVGSIQFYGVMLKCDVNAEPYVIGYEWRVGATYSSAAVLKKLGGTSYAWDIQVVGTYTIWVAAIDRFGRSSAAASLTVVIAAPTVSTPTLQIVGADLQIDFAGTAGGFAIRNYEIRYGASWAAGISVGAIALTRHIRKIDWVGSRTWWVVAYDVAGNASTAVSSAITIIGPGVVTGTRNEVVDNNALLYWGAPATGSLPIDRYEVRKGVSWVAGTIVGSNGNSTFTAIFEQQAGVYSYWVAAIDTAENVGTAVAIVATINQPPDYVLRDDFNDDFVTGTYTFSNLYQEGGKVYGPNRNETIENHFVNLGWTTPDAQITAGYPLYFQPSAGSGYYLRELDYGTDLSATMVNVTALFNILAGAPTMTVQISYRTSAGGWINAPSGDTKFLIPAFRYVRVQILFSSSGGDDLAELYSLNIKLSGKLATDSGSKAVVSTDAGGTTVALQLAFVDVHSIVVSPLGTTAKYAIYDFVDIPNPTSFKALLFDSAGARLSGNVSYAVRGFL